MNVIYNLSEADCKRAVFGCSQPLLVRGDYLTAYAGVDRAGYTTVLVQADDGNVLLQEGDTPKFVSASPAPNRPWAFRIESVEPLLLQAQFAYAAHRGTSIYVGNDHGDVPFLVVTLLGHDGAYLFRLPEPDVEAWTAHFASPLHCTGRERQLTASTGDPVLDSLLGFTDSK